MPGVVAFQPAGQPEGAQLVVGGLAIAAVAAGGPARRIVPDQQLLRQLGHAHPGVQPAQPQLPVLGKKAVGIAAVQPGQLAPEHDRRMADGRIAKTVAADGLMIQQAVLPVHEMGKASCGLAVAAKMYPRGQQARFGMFRHPGGLQGQALRVADIIGVHAGDERAPGGLQTGVERAGQALMRTMQDAQAGIFRRQGIQQGRRAVGGTVIDGQHLEARYGGVRRGFLPGQGTDGHAQGLFPLCRQGQGCAVPDRQQDGHQRASRHVSSQKTHGERIRPLCP